MPSDQCVSLRVGQAYLMSGDLQNRFFSRIDYVLEFTGLHLNKPKAFEIVTSKTGSFLGYVELICLRLNKPKAFEIVKSTTTVEYAQPFQMRERQSHFNPLNPL
jgi:hypothetical protein